jgi:hypothetical protein
MSSCSEPHLDYLQERMRAVCVHLYVGCNHAEHANLNGSTSAVPPLERPRLISGMRRGASMAHHAPLTPVADKYMSLKKHDNQPKVYAAILDWRRVALHVQALTLI